MKSQGDYLYIGSFSGIHHVALQTATQVVKLGERGLAIIENSSKACPLLYIRPWAKNSHCRLQK